MFVFPPCSAFDSWELPGNLTVGAQNAYPTKRGSFTGEIGTEQLEEFGIKTILIGHSERRHILGENQEFVASKFSFFKEHGFKIVYCIGEPLEVRQKGSAALFEYIQKQLNGIDTEYGDLILAYEPVWAIGTGLGATPADIAFVHGWLKERVQKPILYGGSVNLGNIEEILSVKECDGVLVGTASWDVEQFCKMIAIGQKVRRIK